MMRKIVIFILSLIYVAFAWGEDLPISKIVPVSPNATSLGLYGSVPLGHYTGTANISIPIYELALDGKNFPIEITYNTQGIKVSQEASNVGLGWTLNVGGCIIKEERGWNDFESPSGYHFNAYYDANGIHNSANVKPYYFYKNNEDTEPDLFHYNFGGYSGTMFFNQFGKGKNQNGIAVPFIVENKEYLDIKFKFGLNSQWVITDNKGYRYYFGTREETATYGRTFPYYISNGEMRRSMISILREKEPYVITAWHLDSIVSTNKNAIKFKYKKDKIITPISISEEIACTYSNPSGVFQIREQITNSPLSNYHYSYSIIEQAYISSIEFCGGKIEFNTTDRSDIESLQLNTPVQRINNISIFNENKKIKNVDLIQSYYGNIDKYLTCRLRLDSVKINDQAYHFKYNSNNLPDKDASYSADYWNYYNASPIPNKAGYAYKLIPPFFMSNIYFQGQSREPNESVIQNGILTAIEYPTGGRTKFEYEMNVFENGFYSIKNGELKYSILSNGGGLRIKQITDSIDLNNTIKRAFVYSKNNTTSGKLMTRPKYHQQNPSEGVLYATSLSIIPFRQSASGCDVGYSYVEEHIMNGNTSLGYTSYSFMNSPNLPMNDESYYFPGLPTIPGLFNGKIKEINQYDKSGILLKKQQNKYDIAYNSEASIMGFKVYVDKYIMATTHPSETPSIWPYNTAYYNLTSGTCILTNSKMIDYYANGNLVNATEFQYNNNNLLIKYEKSNINGEIIEKHIKYAVDYNDPVSQKMQEQHLVGIPLETILLRGGEVISAQKTVYKYTMDMFLPESLFNLNIKNITTLSNYHNYYDKYIIFDKYNNNGKLLQYTTKNGVPTSYIWSYSGQYPIVSIVNGTYEESATIISSILGSSIKELNNIKNPDSTKLVNGDIQKVLKDAHVTTYTYEPLIGVTSITNAQGGTIYYDYDRSGRLEKSYIKGKDFKKTDDNKILQFVKYYYQK